MPISLEDLLGDITKEQEDAIKIGVSVDVATRLAMIAFGRSAKPHEIGPVFDAIKEALYSDEMYSENKEIVEPFIKELEDGILELSKSVHSET